MSSPRNRKLRHLPLSKLFPNMVTIGGLCCGLSSIRYAMLDRWEISLAFIIAAAIIDGMDGSIARLLKSTSDFGAQLDSLSDFVCFGVAPILVIYMWQLENIKGYGWALVMFYVVCCALRLARFNVNLVEEETRPWQKNFFTGVPSPAGALLTLLPLIISIEWGTKYNIPPLVLGLYIFAIGLLMASRIPTFALKKVRIRHDLVLPFMLLFGLALVVFVIEPWKSLAAISIGYLITIPISGLRYRRLSQAESSSPE